MQLRFVDLDNFNPPPADPLTGVTMVPCPEDWDQMDDTAKSDWVGQQLAQLNPDGHRQVWEIVPDGYPAYPE